MRSLAVTCPTGSAKRRRNASPLLRNFEGNIMEIQRDFRDLFALFAANPVEYMIVGGYALAYYGAPRYTGEVEPMNTSSIHRKDLL